MRTSSIVLLSGGLDSLASFHWARHETDLMLGLTFHYGQRAAEREIQASANICRHADVQHKVIKLPWFETMKSSALVNEGQALPKLNIKDLENQTETRRSAKAVWVPNRNGVFLNIAASLAEDMVANWIVVGFNKEEAQTFADNSQAFVEITNQFFKYSTNEKVIVKSPMGDKTKTETLRWLLDQDIDLSHLWSCYRGEDKMCGSCESCVRCQRALKEAGANRWSEVLF